MGDFQKFLGNLGEWFTENREAIAKWTARITLVVALPLAALALFPVFLQAIAPRIDPNEDLYSVNRPVAFTFLDVQGREVGHRGAIVGKRLTLEEMPAYVPAAFIAMEDRRFYSHNGIDMRGLIRAMIVNARAGHFVAGGSTITQQTAKIVYTNQERTVARKLAELMDAASLEKSLSKKQILELYLNRIYLGSGAYGVDGAARVYFSKSAKDLTVAQAAMLATLTRAPSVFSPRRDLPAAQLRARKVLRAMYIIGAISREDAEDAMAHPAVVTDRTVVDSRNYFFDTAADEARDLLTKDGQTLNSDLVVHTTLEPQIQDAARQNAVKVIRSKRGHKMRASEVAVIVMKTDGAVSALVGGVDYDGSTFNRATQAHRQPGSSFKPFVYLAAIENGISPWDVRDDGAVDIDGWTPTNYGGRRFGTVTIAKALANSINTITAGLAQEVGISTVVEAAQRVGISSPLEENASLALGTSEVTPMEMVSAYGAFASGGYRVRPYLVTEIDDTGGHVLFKRTPPTPERVIADHVDKDMVAMLAGVVTSGTGRGAALPDHEVAGKTGTTQDYHDAWFVGFSHDYVAAVWVGNDDSSHMRNVTGGTLPAEIWKATMTVAEKGLPNTPLDKSTPQTSEQYASQGGMYGDTETGLSVDNTPEGGASVAAGGPARPSADHNQPGQQNNFFDWLFGRNAQPAAAVPERRVAPPAPPPPPRPPRREYSGDEDPYADGPPPGYRPPPDYRGPPDDGRPPDDGDGPDGPYDDGPGPGDNGNH
jgi:penicillin-binding protein 1A